jgi:hypothetical protein
MKAPTCHRDNRLTARQCCRDNGGQKAAGIAGTATIAPRAGSIPSSGLAGGGDSAEAAGHAAGPSCHTLPGAHPGRGPSLG